MFFGGEDVVEDALDEERQHARRGAEQQHRDHGRRRTTARRTGGDSRRRRRYVAPEPRARVEPARHASISARDRRRALRAAPPPPSWRRSCRERRSWSSPRQRRIVEEARRLGGDARRRDVVLEQLGDDARVPAMRFGMPMNGHRDEAAREREGQRRDPIRRSPSVARGARSRASPCPTPPARRRSRHQIVRVALHHRHRQRGAAHASGNVRIAQRVREGERALRVAPGARLRGGLRHDRQQQRASPSRRLPGSSATSRFAGSRPWRAERLRARPRRPHAVEQRMADELGTGAAAGVERRLEREDDREPVDAAGDLAHAAAPPRPHLRADVVEHRHAAAVRDPARARG